MHQRYLFLTAIVAALSATSASHARAAELATAEPIAIAKVERSTPVGFVQEILPILRQNCLACHAGAEPEGDLRLDTPEAIRKGGAHGPAVVPRDAAASRLLQSAAHLQAPAMPPADNDVGAVALTPDQLGLVKLWIEQGAEGEAASVAREIARRAAPNQLQPILALAMSPDDAYVACNRGDKLFVYDVRSNRLEAQLVDPALEATRPGAAHDDFVRSLVFNRAGDLLASGGFRTVKLWRRPVTRRERELTAGQTARAVALSPSGTTLAIGSAEGSIELVDLIAGSSRRLSGHGQAVTALEFAADDRLYSASLDKTVRLWDVAQAAPAGQFTTPAEVTALALLPAGQPAAGQPAAGQFAAGSFATGHPDGAIRFWPATALSADASPDKPVSPSREIKVHTQTVTAMRVLANGQLVSGSSEGRVRIWNTASGEQVRDLVHEAPVTAVAVRPDGQRIVSAGANGVVRIWNPADGMLVGEIKLDAARTRELARSAAALRYARVFVDYRKEAHREAEEIVKREAATVEAAQKGKVDAEKAVADKTEPARKAVEAREAAAAVAAAAQKPVQEANEKLTAAKAALAAAETAVQQAQAGLNAAVEAANKDSSNAALTAARQAAEKSLAETQTKRQDAQNSLRQANEAHQQAERKLQEAKQQANNAADSAREPERLLLEARNMLQGAINFIPTAIAVHERAKAAVPVAQKGIADAEAALARLDTEHKALFEAAPKSVKPVGAVSFSADGRQLAVASESHGLAWFDGERGAPVETVSPQQPDAIVCGPEGRLISIDAQRRVSVWQRPSAWTLERTIGDPRNPALLVDRVLSVDFSADGKLLATGGGLASRTGEVKLWNVADGSLVRELPAANNNSVNRETVHRDTVFAVRFSPNGERLATTSADRMARVFRVSDGTLEQTFSGHTHHVLGVAWRPDGRTLATCSADQTLKIWDVATGTAVRTLRGTYYQIGEYRREITSVSFVGDTEHLLASSGDRTVRMHRTSSNYDVQAFKGAQSFMYAAACTSDGNVIVGGGRDGVLHVWNGENSTPLVTFTAAEPALARKAQ